MKKPAQLFHAGSFLGFTHALPLFCSLTFTHCSIPYRPPNVNIPDTNSHVQLTRFSMLFGGSFYEQQLVLGELSNTMK